MVGLRLRSFAGSGLRGLSKRSGFRRPDKVEFDVFHRIRRSGRWFTAP